MGNRDYFSNFIERVNVAAQSISPVVLEEVAQKVKKTSQAKSKVIVIGNGGSAAMASHVAVDLTKAAGVRAVNFNEADLLTCLANDYGYAFWVEQALHFYGDPGDLAIVISSSGESKNLINGAKKAKSMGIDTVTLSGFSPDNPLRKCGVVNLWVDSAVYNVVEMAHHIWLVAIVDYLVDMESQA